MRARYQPWFASEDDRLAKEIAAVRPRTVLHEDDEWTGYVYDDTPYCVTWVHKDAQAAFERLCD